MSDLKFLTGFLLRFLLGPLHMRPVTGMNFALGYSRTLVTPTRKGNEKQFELARVRVIEVNWQIQFAMLKIDSY